MNDGVFELSETLIASLSSSSNEAPPRVTISPDSADISILDDDSMYLVLQLPINYFILLISVLTFGFDPIEYEFGEDSGTNPISASLLSGDLGEFTVVLIAATDDSNTDATATGEKLGQKNQVIE